jgi:hypothetical protein
VQAIFILLVDCAVERTPASIQALTYSIISFCVFVTCFAKSLQG